MRYVNTHNKVTEIMNRKIKINIIPLCRGYSAQDSGKQRVQTPEQGAMFVVPPLVKNMQVFHEAF